VDNDGSAPTVGCYTGNTNSRYARVGRVSTLSSFWREHITNLHHHNEISRSQGKASVATLLASDSRGRASMLQIFHVIALLHFGTLSESLRLFTAFVRA
jgi:hypothetical protein